MAAEQTGRRARAIEIEPVFVDVAIRRWQAATGLEAVLDGTDRTWKDVAKARKVPVGDPACRPNPRTRAPNRVARTSPTSATAPTTPGRGRRRGKAKPNPLMPAATEPPGDA